MALSEAPARASGPTTPLIWLPELIVRQGKDPDVICRSVGLDDSFRKDPLKPFPLPNYFHVLNGLIRHLELPELGVLIADRVQISDLRRLPPVLDAAETLEEALSTVCETIMQQSLPGSQVALTTYRDRCLLSVEMPQGAIEARRPFMELLILLMRCIVRRTLGPAWNPQRLLFRHKNASSHAALQRSVGMGVTHFGEVRDGIEFSTELLDEPVPGRSIDLDMLHHVLHRELLLGRGSIDQTARVLGLSRRSLQRRMKEMGVTYKRLLLNLRMDLALEYLKSSTSSVTAIAKHLGYNHHADFSRSFKSRHGLTPIAFRQQHAAEQAAQV